MSSAHRGHHRHRHAAHRPPSKLLTHHPAHTPLQAPPSPPRRCPGGGATKLQGVNANFAVVHPTHTLPTGSSRAPLRTRVSHTHPSHARHRGTTAQVRTVHDEWDDQRRDHFPPRHVDPSEYFHNNAPPHAVPTHQLCISVAAGRRRCRWAARWGKRCGKFVLKKLYLVPLGLFLLTFA